MIVETEKRKKIATILRGIRQVEIADLANVSQTVISNYFNGTLNEEIVSDETVQRIEDAIKVLVKSKLKELDSILI